MNESEQIQRRRTGGVGFGIGEVDDVGRSIIYYIAADWNYGTQWIEGRRREEDKWKNKLKNKALAAIFYP